MSPSGGMRWVRGLALLLVFTGSGAVLSACEYTGEEPSQAPAAPGRSRPAPAPLPTVDLELAKAREENQVELDIRLGPKPEGVVLGGSGGLGGDGFSASVAGVSSGSYTVTAACLGVTKASLVIWQPNYRGGTQQELTLDCRQATRVELDLATGPVSAHAVRMTTEQGSAAVAGFWMVPAP